MQPDCCTRCNPIQGNHWPSDQAPLIARSTELVLGRADTLKQAGTCMLLLSAPTHITACLHNLCYTLIAGHSRQLGLDRVLPLHHVDVAGVDGALQRRYTACW